MSAMDLLIGSRRSRSSLLSSLLIFVARRMVLWIHAFRSRKQLSRLSEAALADIGMTREQAVHEASRPFWDILDSADDRGRMRRFR